MGQWNLLPDSATNFPACNMHPAVTAPGGLNFHRTPPYNIINLELPAADLDFTVGALSVYCNPYMTPLSEWNISYTDDVQPFKTMRCDEAPMNFQPPGNPWLDMHFGDVRTLAWPPIPNSHYIHGYQTTDTNRSATGFLHPPVVHFHSNSHHPIRPTQVGCRSPCVTTSSYRVPQMNATGARPTTFLPPFPPWSFRWYGPHRRREIILDQNARHRYHTSPHLRVLPADEVAILEIPGYQEVGDPIDHHRDMRSDIDHMSYEELLALGEHIGSACTGLTGDFIENHLKMSSFMPSSTCPDQPKINFCVVCQADYEYEESIGKLDCGHEYHRECITRWLLLKNASPVCKVTALSSSRRRMDP